MNWDDLSPRDPTSVSWDSLSTSPPPKSDSDFARGAKESFQQLPQLGYGLAAGGAAALENVVGEGGIVSGAKKAAIKGFNEWGDKIAAGSKESDSWDYSYDQAKQGNFGSLVDWLQHGLGYVSGQAVQTLATGGIGAVGGKFVASTAAKQIAEGMVAKEAARLAAEGTSALTAEQIAKQATANVAAKFATLGQTAALGGSAVGMEGGEIFGDLTASNPERALTGAELGKAFAATLAAGGLEFVGDKVGLDIMLGKSALLKPAASATGLGGRAARGAIAAAGAAPIEGGTEYAQTLLEEAGKGNDPTSPESLKQAREAAALGALGGVAVGGASGIIRGAQQRAQPAAEPAPALALTNNPEPLISFPDGTVGRRADVDNYVNGLPEDQRAAARAKLMGLGPQDAKAQIIQPLVDVMATTSVDDAIAAAQGSMDSALGKRQASIAATPAANDDPELDALVQSEQRDLNTLRAQTVEGARKQRELDAIQEQSRLDLGRTPDQQVAAAQAATDEAPTAMQLAMQKALQRGKSGDAAQAQPPSTRGPSTAPAAGSAGGGVSPGIDPAGPASGRAPGASPSAAVPRPDILPTDIARNDGQPFQTESGARLKQRYAGGVAGSDIVQVEGGYVVRPKTQPSGVPNEQAQQGEAGAVARAPVSTEDARPADAGQPAAAAAVAPAAQAVQPAQALNGKPIDKDWTAFTPESGTKGVPRAEMPQIKAEHRGALTQFLAGRGITHESVELPAADLKPTQAEYSPEKVAKAKTYEGGDRSILVSSDGHILDGHHQWAARLEDGQPVKAIRLDAPIDKLLAEVKEFPSAATAAGATKPKDQRLVPVSKRVAPSDDDLMQQELERLYQEDIKASIRQRLGLEPKAKEAKAKASPFRTFLRKHGISTKHVSDLTGERGGRAFTRLVGTFRKNGLDLDELALRAVEEGYLTRGDLESDTDNGGTNKLAEMIQAEIRGEAQVSTNDASDKAEDEAERVSRMEIEGAADALGLPYDANISTDALATMVRRVQRALEESKAAKGSSKEDRVRANAIAAAQRIEAKRQQYEAELEEFAKASIQEQNAVLDVLLDADGEPVIVRQLDVMAEAAWNASLAEWEAENGQADTAEDSPARQAGPPDGEGAGERAGDGEEAGAQAERPAAEGQSEGLSAPTREDILAQQEQAAAAEKADAAEQKRLADKAKADAERGEFTLTGSDRPADVAAAAGQADIFGNPAEQASEILDAANVSGKDRLDILKDVKSGALTPDEVQAAYPKAKAKERLTDAGEELIRNRRGKLKGLAWDDVSAMNDTLKVAQVTKSNVWPRPDYAKMVEDGAPAWKAAALKAIYDKLATAPATRATPTDADLKAYIETMNQVREALSAELDRVAAMGGGAPDLWKTLKSGNVFGKVFPVPADARPLYGAPSPFDRKSEQGKENNRRALLIGGNNAIQALQFGSRTLSKVRDLLAEGFPAKQEAWQKSYEVRQTATRDNDVPEAERTGQPQDRFYVYEKGSRWRLAKGQQDGGYATQEQAEAFARSLVVKKREALPPSRGLDLADVTRIGPDWRGGKDVTAQDVIDRFGFRGVNLGEYVKAKQGMAQLHLNHVFDAFSDLADLLGVPAKAMSLNGTLGVAVGAQGGGKALAHFVPGVNEINITRDSGAGALAHEFGHALDHYLATQHGRAASVGKRPYLSAVVDTIRDAGEMRPEVMDAMRVVMKTINSRPMTEEEMRAYMADQRALNQRRLDRWVDEFKKNKGADPAALAAVAEKLKRGDLGDPQDTDVETNLAEFMQAAGLKPGNSIASNAFAVAYRLRDLADEARFMASHIPQVGTDYAKASDAMDAKKRDGDGYWSTPWEKFARAFETFAMDALADRERESLYLSGLVDSQSWEEWSSQTGKSVPYPAGAERLAMQQAFQKLVDTIQTREDEAGNVAMYEPADGAYDVNAPRKPYTDDRQLQLFLDSQPDPSQTGPAVQAARRNAVAAVDDLHATGSILAQALSSDYAARQRVSLVGQKVASNEDLAVLAQVYRDPRFETFRVFFTDANNRVVSQMGLTSRLPASATVLIGTDMDRYLADLSAAAGKRGATSFYLLHNHPSGQPEPSRPDIFLTANIGQRMPGLDFKGHVVIDTNQYAVIDRNGGVTMEQKDFGQAKPLEHAEWGSLKIAGPDDVMALARQLQVDEDAVTLIALDSQLKVRGITTVPASAITANRTRTSLTVTKAALRENGSRIVAVGRNREKLKLLGSMVLDAVAIGPEGNTVSMAMNGHIRGNQGLFPNDRRPRLSPDTSPDFHYLRPQTMLQVPGRRVAESVRAEEQSPAEFRRTLERAVASSAPRTTVTDLQAAIREMTGSFLRGGLGRVVATTSSEIKSTWEPLIGRVNIEAEGNAGEAQAFFNPATNTVFLIADHIPKGQETAVLAHELMHKHGVPVLGQEGWDRLHAVIGTWKDAPRGSLEAMIYSEAAEKVAAVGAELSNQELFPYAVQAAISMGVKPSLAARAGSVERWLGAVRAALRQVWEKITGKPETFAAQDLVNLAFGIAQRENNPGLTMQDQTSTPAFQKWFGDSKVVDEAGAPMVVYHGTRSDVAAFDPTATRSIQTDPNAQGIYLTRHPEDASGYASRGGGEGGNVVPAYVALKNPFIWPESDLPPSILTKAKRAELEAAGHDGILYRGGEEVVAFHPEQIKSAIGNNGAFDPANPDIRFARATIVGQTTRQYTPEQLRAMKDVGFQTEQPTLKERAQALWKDAGKKLAQGIVDQFAPVKDLDATAYGLLRLAKGASGAFEAFLHGGKLKLTDNVYDFDGTERGGVIDKLLIPLQGEHHDFMRWVAANRAERLQSEGKENLFTPQDIADLKTLANGTTSFDYEIQNGARAGQKTRDRTLIYADSLKTFNAFNSNILDLAEQSGLIDGGSRKLWEHEFYVPFYRVADDSDGGIRGANIKGGVVRQEAFKALKGGKNALNADLLDNTLMNWAHLLDAAAKNRAARATIEAAERLGVATGGNQSTLAQMGASINNKHGVVWFMDGGEKRYSLVDDPYLMTALSSLEYAGMRNPVMNAMGMFKHALTIGVTASPFFKIRNLIRDSVQVIGTSGINANPLANVAQGWKLTDPKSDAYFRLLAGGGTIHFGTMLEGSEAKRVQALVESGIDDATILSNQGKVKQFYRKFIEPGITAYNELGNRGEAVNRATLYDQLRRQGMNHADASLQARDLMDFSMQGSFTTIRFLTQVVPFLNARLQGLYKLGRAAKEDPARFSAVVGAATLMSLSLLAAFSDDDDWKKREEWDRNTFWWFKFGGTAFRIPKPFEIGAIATLAERGFELAFDKEMTSTRFRKQVMTLLGDNLSMNPVPQLIKPIVDVYANKDSFSGRPIETLSMERLKSEYRFNDRTSMAARGASTALNSVTGLVGAESLSPVQIDHMLRGYFGWLGSFVVGAGDVIARPVTDQPRHATPDYWKVATGGMMSDLRDAPSRYVSQMYDQAREIEQAYGTWKALQKEGKTLEAKEFADDNRDKLVRYRAVEGVKRKEAKLNERIRVIERSNMDSDAKRDLIRSIRVQQDTLARAVAP